MGLNGSNHSRSFAPNILRTALALAAFGLFVVGLALPSSQPAVAAAGINKTINFQGRLLTAAGAVVADGNYNMRFKVYQDGDGTLAGDTGGSGGALKWTEEYKNSLSEGVVVKNGYYSVALGTYCAFSGSACTGGQTQGANVAVDWNQDTLWLSMDVGGTTAGAITYDGELLPMRRMSSAVYALQAGSCTSCVLQAPTSTAQNTITPTVNSVVGLTVNATSGTAAQALVVNQTQAADALDINSSGSGALLKVRDTTATPADVLTIADGGAATFKSQTNSISAFLVQNAAGNNLLAVDSTNDQVSVNDLEVGTAADVGSYGHLFTDGFEQGTEVAWTGTGGTGTKNTVSTTVRGGKYSEQISTATQSGYVQETVAASTTIYGREYFNITTTTNPTILQDFGTAPMGSGTHLYIYLGASGFLCYNYGGNGTAAGGTSACSSTAPSTSAWHKIETKVVQGAANTGVLQVFLDGALVNSNSNAINISTGAWNTSVANFSLGNGVNSAGSTNVFFDDVAVDTVATGDSASAYVADSLHVAGTAGITVNSEAAFMVQNTSGNDLFTVDTNGTQVFVGAATSCPGISFQGKFCVGQSIAGSSGSAVNANNLSTIATTGVRTLVGQKVIMTDTSSSIANILQDVLVDNSGTTNTSAVINTISGVVPTSQSGNFLQFYSGSSVSGGTITGGTLQFGVSNAGGITANGNLTFAQSNPVISASTAATGLTVQAPTTGVLTLNTVGAGEVDVGTTNAATTKLGSLTGTATTIQGGTGAGAIALNTGSGGTIALATAGTGNVTITTNSATSGLTVTSATANSASAVQVKNLSGNQIFTVDTAANTGQGQIVLGKASTNNGQVLFDNSTNANTVAILSGATSASGGTGYAMTLPLTGGAGTQCLQSTGGSTVSTTTLIFSSCSGTTPTLQQVYAASSAPATIALTNNASNGITISNVLGNSSSTGAMLNVSNAYNGAMDGLDISSAGTGALLKVTDSTATAADVFTIADGGAAIHKSQTNSTTAFQIQNSSGGVLENFDTTNPITDVSNSQVNNEVTNGSFETGVTGWAKTGASQVAVAQDTFQQLVGNDAMKVVTTNADGAGTDGASYTLSTSTLVSNTRYTMSFNVKNAPGADWATMEIGRAENGVTKTACLAAQTVSSDWAQYTCTFTTGTTSSTPFIYIRETDASTHTFWVDGVYLARWSLLANASVEQAGNIGTAGDWVKKNGAETTFAQNTTAPNFVDGKASLQVTTQAVANEGAKHNITLNNSTLYTLTFEASASASFSTLEAGYSSDGSTDNTVCMTAQTVGTSWASYTCSFTTPASSSGTPFFYIKQTDAVIHTIFIDTVQLTAGDPLSAYQEGKLQVNATLVSPLTLQNTQNSTTALQVLNSSGGTMASMDTTQGGKGLVANTPISATVAVAQSAPWESFPLGGTSLSISPHAIGNLIVVAIGVANTGSSVTSIGNTDVSSFHYVTSINDATNTRHIEIWEGIVTATTAAQNINFGWANGAPANNIDYDAQEFTAGLGAGTLWSVTASNTKVNTTSTTVTFPTITPSLTGELYWGYAFCGGTCSAASPSAGFTNNALAGSTNLSIYNTYTTGGIAYSPVGTQTSSTSTSIGLVIGASTGAAMSVQGSQSISVDSSAAVNVQDGAGESIFGMDTVNRRLTINTVANGLILNTVVPGGENGIYLETQGTIKADIGVSNASGQITSNSAAGDLNVKSSAGNIWLAAGGVTPTVEITTSSLIVGQGSNAESPGTAANMLVLDNSDTAPTQANGAMYYNTTDNTFMCGVNSVWTSCGNGLLGVLSSISATNLTTTTDTAFAGASFTYPAGDCQPGVTYLISAGGYSNSGSLLTSKAMNLFLYNGATNLEDLSNEATFASIADNLNHSWTANLTVTCQTLNSVMISGFTNSDSRVSGFDSSAGNARTGVISIANGGTFTLHGAWQAAPGGTGVHFTITTFVAQRLAP